MDEFIVKDSGERREFDSGMVRDTAEGKMQWHRIVEGPMARRWAQHLTAGAVKYPDLEDGSANWTLASGSEEYRRFRESAFRHFMQWFFGERDEDHAAAVFFNINGAEYVRDTQFLGDPAAIINVEAAKVVPTFSLTLDTFHDDGLAPETDEPADYVVYGDQFAKVEKPHKCLDCAYDPDPEAVQESPAHIAIPPASTEVVGLTVQAHPAIGAGPHFHENGETVEVEF